MANHSTNIPFSKIRYKAGHAFAGCQVSKRSVQQGPGFVVSLRSYRGNSVGFIVWWQTGIAELSPNITEAWRFPTLRAANDAVALALGANAKGCKCKIISCES